MARFVLNDEKMVNSYGFRVATGGLNLDRFQQNPVMLNSHFNDPSGVVGKWIDIRIEDGQLTAEPEFDEQDEQAKLLKGKVDRGYLKGASMGLSFNPEKMELGPDGNYLLREAELMEASIVAVPANAAAVRLYSNQGTLLTKEQVQLSIASLKQDSKPFNNQSKNEMKKIILSLAVLTALDLHRFKTEDGVDVDSINAAVLELKGKYDKVVEQRDALQTANQKMTDQLAAQLQAKVTALVDGAIAAGKLKAAEKESWVKLATNDYDLAAKTLGSIPGKKSLAGQVNNPSAGVPEVKTVDEFEKLTFEQKLAFKEENPEAYKQLFA